MSVVLSLGPIFNSSLASTCVLFVPFINRFPDNADCPDDGIAVNPDEDYAIYYDTESNGYFFPDFSVDNCGFGHDYPAWM